MVLLLPAHAAPISRKHAPPADIGLDWATVTQTTALETQPDAASPRRATLSKGDLLFLVSRERTAGWLNVIQSKSGHQGWVRAATIVSHLTRHPQHEVSLNALSTGGMQPPVLAVTNSTDGGVYLHLNQQPEIAIPARATRTVTVPAGIYAFNLAGGNTRPLFGHKVFINGTQFDWTFYVIRGKHQTDNPISNAQRADIQQRQADIDALSGAIAATRLKLDSDRNALTQQSAACRAASDAVDAKHQTLDHTSQADIDAYNALVDASNAQNAAYHTAEDAFNAEADTFNTSLQTLHDKRKQLEAIADQINTLR